LTSRRPNLVWRFVISAVAAAAKLWPKNENLIFESDFNGGANRRGKTPLGKERGQGVTSIISAMVMLTEQAR
jgi:hypothetical protein